MNGKKLVEQIVIPSQRTKYGSEDHVMVRFWLRRSPYQIERLGEGEDPMRSRTLTWYRREDQVVCEL